MELVSSFFGCGVGGPVDWRCLWSCVKYREITAQDSSSVMASSRSHLNDEIKGSNQD